LAADGQGKLTILVAEKLGKAGIDMLRAYGTVVEAFDMSQADLCAKVSLCDALIVRSATKVRTPPHCAAAGELLARRLRFRGLPSRDWLTRQLCHQVTRDVIEASKGRLKVVGRAGVGIDNVDLAAATEFGVLVVNAPTANTIAAAEHGIALLCALSRNIAQADASMKARARMSLCWSILTRCVEGRVETHQVCRHLPCRCVHCVWRRCWFDS
jgi:D-3-phosphoglycerate dehydrogenase